MKLTEEQYELIEAYLKNELSTSDRALFEAEIQADVELQKELSIQRDFRLGMRALGIQQALERARNQYKANVYTSKPVEAKSTVIRSLSTWKYWTVAASVVVILGIGYYTYQQTAERQVDIAYAETAISDTNDNLLKSFPSKNVSAETRNSFLDAFRKYKAGNYVQVIERLKTIPVDKQTIHYKNYFLGLSYLANNQYIDAIPLLLQAKASPSLNIKQKAEWFLALAYVKNNQKERALPILKRISIDKDHPFQSLAQRVLNKID